MRPSPHRRRSSARSGRGSCDRRSTLHRLRGRTRTAAPRSAPALHEFDESPDRDAPVVDVGSSAVGRGGAVGRLLKKFFADARSHGGGAAGAAPPTHWTKRRARGTRSTPVSSAAATRSAEVGLVERGLRTYPEWDVNRAAVPARLVHGCRHGGNARRRPPPALGDVHALRRPLARLGLDLERRHRQLQGDDIDIDAAVEAHVATRAGVAPEEAIYIDCLRSRRDLSVLVLLDVSGSAAEPGLTGKTVHEQQQAVAGAFGRRAARARRSRRALRIPIERAVRGARRRRSSASTRRSTRGRCAGSARSSRPATRDSVPRSGTVRRSSKQRAARRGGSSSSSPTGSPTTTATRATTAKPMRGAPWPKRAGAAPRASVSASAQRPNRTRCGACSARPRTQRSRAPSSCRMWSVRCSVRHSRAADYQRRAWQRTERTRERLHVERRTG